MSSEYESSNATDEQAAASFILHNAAEEGDAETIAAALASHKAAVEGAEGADVGSLLDLELKDHHSCTALHISLLHGHLDCARLLLEAGASFSRRCEGSPLLVLAICAAAATDKRSLALEAVKLLVGCGCSPWDRDDEGRLALHWAAELGLCEAAEALITQGMTEQARDQGEGNVSTALITEAEDEAGDTPLHCAARCKQPGALGLLLGYQGQKGASEVLNVNKETPLHCAASSGCYSCAVLLMQSCPAALEATDKFGRTPKEVAMACGQTHLVELLSTPTTADLRELRADTNDGGPASSRLPTALFAPEACMEHRTHPEPLIRGECEGLPPENTCRLQVLMHPETGILRTTEFEGLVVDTDSEPVAMVDILRVHDWGYVQRIQDACMSIPDTPADVSHLDPDTAVSRGTWPAGLAAAGAVCRAVDAVMRGEAQNAFCAIRPPGHHAGPTGVVTSKHDSHGSHGFCLLNNVAIGAAYAMDRWRQDIQRVAILDFDVHHGNGTEACVVNTIPSSRTFSYKTPFSKTTETVSCYKPWLSAADPDNILFASVQGYGKKHVSIDAYVYPGSGATSDSREAKGRREAMEASTEDPRGEFLTVEGAEVAPLEAPRIINVGLGQGKRVGQWRRAWRDKIIPALAAFHPDLIFISAGFDAHLKDEINFGYLGISEPDYAWITDQICQVANLCCGGRVVSALEGGYRIQGGIVSAFARSVAAHVRVLNSATITRSWSAEEAEKERLLEQEERKLEQEERAKRQAARAAYVEQALLAQQQAHEEAKAAAGVMPDDERQGGQHEVNAEVAASPAAQDRPKRRRAAVDYVALNKELAGHAAVSQPPSDEPKPKVAKEVEDEAAADIPSEQDADVEAVNEEMTEAEHGEAEGVEGAEEWGGEEGAMEIEDGGEVAEGGQGGEEEVPEGADEEAEEAPGGAEEEALEEYMEEVPGEGEVEVETVMEAGAEVEVEAEGEGKAPEEGKADEDGNMKSAADEEAIGEGEGDDEELELEDDDV